jgi:uncharacterized protein (TIGR00299 family) protein
MRIAYFDCFSGVAGDMIIGALLDAGLPFDDLKGEISKIGITGYNLSVKKVKKNHIAATKFSVELKEKQPSRSPNEIRSIISDSGLDDDIKRKAISIFNRLAEAEAKAHGESVEDVHFHEVGAVDAIIDICGAAIGLKLWGIEEVYSSPLSLGRGTIETEHGTMPVPAPATAELIKGVPTVMTGIEAELTTPTGAAILKETAEFITPAQFTTERIGYGAGSRDLPELPNLLRVMIGETATSLDGDTITVLETNLDRATSETLGGLLDSLFKAGALDVYFTPILMKKNRPGHLLTILCNIEKKDKLAGIVFERGMTLGMRARTVSRIKLKRKTMTVVTSGGDVSVKLADLDGRYLIFPEYDDMAAAMERSGKSYEDIFYEIKSNLRKES